MKLPFCTHHIITFLNRHGSCSQRKPLDLALSEYFRQHKSLGAHDRRQIGATIYSLIRWKGLLDHLYPQSILAAERLERFEQLDWPKVLANPKIPEAIRLGSTPFFFTKLQTAYGLAKARELCKVLLSPAPIAIRANKLKTNREDLIARWEGKFTVSPSKHTPDGIIFSKREALFALPEFKEGLFEMQDEGSQLVASLVQAQGGQHILDYCSGSGGKSLAFAPAMGGRGQIYLHDIRPAALIQAKQRFKRAGIQHAQFLPPDHPKLSELKGKMDWVLADVPCSGSGTLRRHPEMMWNIDEALLQRLTLEQRKIFENALPYVRPGGRIVYATCSILPEENEEQMRFFQSCHQLTIEEKPLTILPTEGGMDGFFAVTFRKEPI
ncbi:MAG: RsmB/NOP family class I SAM-dependent RNA methyltransferase [Chlamydiales bacterium]|nr:RsmB/NOP family class I SAM-dependent RNA methyltransferase [Chlamydiales bacterium]